MAPAIPAFGRIPIAIPIFVGLDLNYKYPSGVFQPNEIVRVKIIVRDVSLPGM